MATNPIGLSLCFFGGYEPGFDIGLHPPAIAAMLAALWANAEEYLLRGER